ncbi:hypothetical protein HII31_00623 [Pseudocercospora fuligena]|uniref:Uncharacterized protein n=1 Tax=Pseudocercospora fuligena TaxID=685502 RepID=A0A8H6VRJ3_9PEZI|nr:hypothetical protein HII31_00623 [Pseudocercospora fuligena]
MARDASSITPSGRRLRRSPSSRDQTIRAVFDRDQSASPPTQHRQRNAQRQSNSPSAQRSRYVSSGNRMNTPQQHATLSHCAPHASRIPAPRSSGTANARAHDSSPPQYHASPSAPRADDGVNTIDTDLPMMDWEQSRDQTPATQSLDSHPFQSVHFYAQQKNDRTGIPNPLTLYPTEVRPAASFAFEMRPVPRAQVHDQVSNQGGCTCADRNCPLIHYTDSGDTHKNECYYEPVPDTARYVSTAELTTAYLNPDADPYAASRAAARI